MHITVQFDEDLGMVVTTPVGTINRENIIRTYEVAFAEAHRHDCFLLLFDIRNCPLGQSMTEGFRLMKDTTKIPGLTFRHLTAVVYDPDTYPTDRAQFIENVVNNRSNPKFKMFDSMEAAIVWLSDQ